MFAFISNQGFNAQFCRTLGASVHQAADVGECLSLLPQIDSQDFSSWYLPWRQLGDRTYEKAQQYLREQDKQSARTALQRAASYYRTAYFFLEEHPEDPRIQECLTAAYQAFQQSLPLQAFEVHQVAIPFSNGEIEGYWVPAPGGSHHKASILLDTGGGDSLIEEIFMATAPAAHSRGFHTLIIEGPGQGRALRQKKLSFIPEWEDVIKAAIDFMENKYPEAIGPIILRGESFGGYLAARAACFEKRLTACIVDPGIVNPAESFLKAASSEALNLLNTDEERFNAIVDSSLSSPLKKFMIKSRLHRFDAKSYAELFHKLQKFDLTPYVKQISCAMLVFDNELEHLTPGQSRRLFDLLECDKEYVLFHSNKGYGGHCQPLAQLACQEAMFNWLHQKVH